MTFEFQLWCVILASYFMFHFHQCMFLQLGGLGFERILLLIKNAFALPLYKLTKANPSYQSSCFIDQTVFCLCN